MLDVTEWGQPNRTPRDYALDHQASIGSLEIVSYIPWVAGNKNPFVLVEFTRAVVPLDLRPGMDPGVDPKSGSGPIHWLIQGLNTRQKHPYDESLAAYYLAQDDWEVFISGDPAGRWWAKDAATATLANLGVPPVTTGTGYIEFTP